MSTKQVTCRNFKHGVVRKETNACSHMTWPTASHPPSICKYYKKGYCAYGTHCKYNHSRPSATAGGAVGSVLHSVPSPGFHSPHPPSDLTAPIVKTNLHEPGKREKRTLVIRDRNLSGMAEEKACPSVVSNPGISNTQSSPEIKPLSYLDAIRSGLDHLEASSSYSSEQQLSPMLQVLHPFDPEQRKAHEKLCMSTFEHEMGKAFAFQASQDKVCSIFIEVILEKASV
uniref:RING-type E3 ubiquitin transferase n=1 Tax=Molossus molossus TaxID=27622 RepID=A0A7J8HCR9_MOLMO|nr:hypothetical protein HJG59_012269 [Molossus molossus]